MGKRIGIINKTMTYLRLRGSGIIVAVGGSAQRSTRSLVTGADTTTLGQVLLSLGFSDLDLLLFAATSELVRLEGVLRLELSSAMLGDVPVSHGCDVMLRDADATKPEPARC
jgi:hypothetical protein